MRSVSLKTILGKILTDNFEDCEILIQYRIVDSKTLMERPKGEIGELICERAVVITGYFVDKTAAKKYLSKMDGFVSAAI